MYTKTFGQISKLDVKEVGGKGASLGEMTKVGIPVPPGFVVTTSVYKQFKDSEIPIEVKEEVLQAFDNLWLPSSAKASAGEKRVAVRSSAVAEDSSSASWAGQLDSYLNVTRDQLIDKIRQCWNSIKSERALSYAGQQSLNETDLVMAVVIQKMVESEVSGVMFTKNPVTGNINEIMIEAGFGLGEILVQGMITPDNFIVDKNELEIKQKDIQKQETMLVFQGGESKEMAVPNGDRPALSDEQVIELANLGKKIENHYSFPQDIEWAFENDNFYIVQSRPITT